MKRSHEAARRTVTAHRSVAEIERLTAGAELDGGDLRTATVADPKADPHGTGKTNFQHYLDQTDPTMPPLTARKALE